MSTCLRVHFEYPIGSIGCSIARLKIIGKTCVTEDKLPMKHVGICSLRTIFKRFFVSRACRMLTPKSSFHPRAPNRLDSIDRLHEQYCQYGPICHRRIQAISRRRGNRNFWGLALSIIFLIILHPAGIEAETASPTIDQNILGNLLQNAFPDTYQNDPKIRISSLEGGLSTSRIYKVVVRDQPYVLRVNNPVFFKKNRRELFVLLEASRKGIAPCVQYASADASTIVMDYIIGEKSSIRLARQKRSIIQLASALRGTHAIPRCPITSPSVCDRMQKLYRLMKNDGSTPIELDRAMEHLSPLKKRQASFSQISVTSHGDLHPGNIFFTKQGVKFIDWSESCWEDPFYDLSCFALCHNYRKTDEIFLLSCYLQHSPNSNEITRYSITKCLDYLYFSIELLFTAHKLAAERKIQLIYDDEILDWPFYISIFEKKKNDLSPQFLHNFGKCALVKFHHQIQSSIMDSEN